MRMYAPRVAPTMLPLFPLTHLPVPAGGGKNITALRRVVLEIKLQ